MSSGNIIVRRTNYVTSGDDYRLRAEGTEWRLCHQHFYAALTGQPTAILPTIEVQAFTPSNEHGVIVSLGMMGPGGQADTMLSIDEARDVALMLLRAADDAERIARSDGAL
jgi:hypothetical protein